MTVVKVSAKDMPQKGVIEISKTGEVFSSVGMLGGGYVDENGNEVTFLSLISPFMKHRDCPAQSFRFMQPKTS